MKRLLIAVAILALVAAGSAQAAWTNIASNVATSYSVSGTGYTGRTFYYGAGTKYASLATFDLSIRIRWRTPAPNG